MLEYLRQQTGPAGIMSFADFMQHALYAPEIGYYTRQARRVGRDRKSDFYTAESLNPVFSQLVVAAVEQLLAPDDPGEFVFVELGAEPDNALLQGREHPFADSRCFRVGEEAVIPGKAVVFANELLDAQPFHRFRFKGGRWRELGVRIEEDTLSEVLLDEPDEKSCKIIALLPESSMESYTLDLPLAAEVLLQTLAGQKWTGLFLTFDYGKTWEELLELHPEGTARAYRNHVMTEALLDQPGEQDLTCHLCWDRLEAVLVKNGFGDIGLERQESFFMHHSQPVIAKIIETDTDRFSPDRRLLQEILHPHHMGHKFQVLSGLRR